VPKKEALKKKILDEAHASRYSIHPGGTKMYHDLQKFESTPNFGVRLGLLEQCFQPNSKILR
jgi:hypothetical protein